MAKNNKTYNDIISENENILNRLSENTPISTDDLISLRNNNQTLKNTISGMSWVVDIAIAGLFGLISVVTYSIYDLYFYKEDVVDKEYKIDSVNVTTDSISNFNDSLKKDLLKVVTGKEEGLIKNYQDVLNENYTLKNQIFDLKDSLQDYKIFNEIAENNYKLKYKKVNKGKTVSYSVDSDYFDNKNKKNNKIIGQKQNDTIVK